MITASMVKELREITGAGMMDCKKALTECDGDITKSIDWLREKGIAKAAKKAGRIAAEGLSTFAISGNKACVVEVNSETDFVAKNDQFLSLLEKTVNVILNSDANSVEEALELTVDGKKLNDLFIDATATIGEKITLRRFVKVEKGANDSFGAYKHMGGKISAVCVLKETDNTEISKDMAMQVASMNPSYISREHMPTEIVEHERGIQLEILKNDPNLSTKSEQQIKGILEGRLSKSLQEISLVDQVFFKDGKTKCSAVLKDANTEVSFFVRYEVGEGIEKKEDNFAEEVAKMSQN